MACRKHTCLRIQGIRVQPQYTIQNTNTTIQLIAILYKIQNAQDTLFSIKDINNLREYVSLQPFFLAIKSSIKYVLNHRNPTFKTDFWCKSDKHETVLEIFDNGREYHQSFDSYNVKINIQQKGFHP